MKPSEEIQEIAREIRRAVDSLHELMSRTDAARLREFDWADASLNDAIGHLDNATIAMKERGE